MDYYLFKTCSTNYFLESALKANETCQKENDLCDKNLRCIRCERKSDFRRVCISGNHIKVKATFYFVTKTLHST